MLTVRSQVTPSVTEKLPDDQKIKHNWNCNVYDGSNEPNLEIITISLALNKFGDSNNHDIHG